jgi:Arc/MetJ family transcription regulator
MYAGSDRSIHPGGGVTTTQINLDDEALEAAAAVLGTRTKVDTVNTALRAVVRRERQRAAIERAFERGTYSGVPVEDEAWR